MEYANCKNGCCTLSTWTYNNNDDDYDVRKSDDWKTYPKSQKAGMILVNKATNKLLLIKSRGMYWGFPKGGINYGESIEDCAMREVKEETGLGVDLKVDDKLIRMYETTYFLKAIPKYSKFKIKRKVAGGELNDVSGIGWIKPECILESQLRINAHCRRIIHGILFK
jgi:8-oxo-dGTP pyrophosphatase MutT (NUDIX family)